MNRTPRYAIGEVFELCSGSPTMTVDHINETDSDESDRVEVSGCGSEKIFYKEVFGGSYRCQWFAGKKLEYGVFREQCLVFPEAVFPFWIS